MRQPDEHRADLDALLGIGSRDAGEREADVAAAATRRAPSRHRLGGLGGDDRPSRHAEQRAASRRLA